MSVTIGDIIKLPSFKEAKIVTGEQNLGKTISSITVLESDDAAAIGKEAFGNTKYYGSEISITGFINIRNDVDAQCRSIRNLYFDGAAAVIVYYIGYILPYLDQRVIDTARELDFMIIAMPENRPELRYSDVIYEVMEAIVKDRLNDTYFASEIIEKISQLFKNQRNINIVLNMLRDRIHCSLFLADEKLRIINAAKWPRDRELPLKDITDAYHTYQIKENEVVSVAVDSKKFWVVRSLIDKSNGTDLYLFIIKEVDGLTSDICIQSTHVLKTFINLWTENYGNIEVKQLICAILNDEPEKMRRIAETLHFNVQNLSTLYIFSLARERDKVKSQEKLGKAEAAAKEFFRMYNNSFLFGIYENKLVMFSARISERMKESVSYLIKAWDDDDIVVKAYIFENLKTTTDAKEAYELYKQYEGSAGMIYPSCRIFPGSKIQFAKKCVNICKRGENELILKKKILEPLLNDERNRELLSTLEVYLLDGESSMSKTAEMMIVHINTIKYRIRSIENILGYRISRMPEIYDLYVAAALERLVKSF